MAEVRSVTVAPEQTKVQPEACYRFFHCYIQVLAVENNAQTKEKLLSCLFFFPALLLPIECSRSQNSQVQFLLGPF
jgi:hypothetical protein